MDKENNVPTTGDTRQKGVLNPVPHSPDSGTSPVGQESKNLPHELPFHQGEPELLNELRRTQRELAESRKHYFELYDLAPIGYLTLDEQGLIQEANLTAATMLRMPRSTLLRQPITRFFLPEEKNIYFLKRKQLFDKIAPQTWDMRMLNYTGSLFWAHLNAIPAMKGACRITFEDITRQKNTEIIMAANIGLSEYSISHSLDELLTKIIDEAEILTGSSIGFFHFLDADQVTLKLQTWSTNTIRTMCTAEGKGGHYSIDKAGVWVECVHTGNPVIHNDYAALPNRKGLPTGHAPVRRELVVPVFRNNMIVAIIGVGNKMNDYLEQDVETVSRLIDFNWDIVSSKRISEDHDRFFSLVPDLVCIASTDGYFRKLNGAWETVLGFTEKELLATPFSDFIHPDDKQETLAAIAKQRGGEKVLNFINRYRCRNGSYRWLEWVSAPSSDNNLFAVARDITERKLIERELQKKDAEIEQFLYSVSHDLRSPLVTVQTFLNYLGRDIAEGDSDLICKDINFIKSAADRMEILLNELLDLARIGNSVTAHDAATFKELVSEALVAVAGQISTGKVNVQVCEADVSLCGDRRHFLQIWQNLLDNSLKYMGDQSSPCIEIGIEQQNGDTCFFIADNGIGIAPEFQEKVFGMFEKMNRNSAGIGMGLAMVKRIVSMYGGNIKVESEGFGSGAKFRFTLPEAVVKN